MTALCSPPFLQNRCTSLQDCCQDAVELVGARAGAQNMQVSLRSCCVPALNILFAVLDSIASSTISFSTIAICITHVVRRLLRA